MAEQNEQIDLVAWASELESERARVDEVNERRARRRGFLVFATDPTADPDAPDYRQVFATEAETPAKAVAKIKPLARGKRLRAYLATGHYSEQLPDARWVA
jgi:DnaJ-domain-containing protein 1